MNPNPKDVKDLDPKLKETYERVMGQTFAPNGRPVSPTPPSAAPTTTPTGPQPVLTPIEDPTQNKNGAQPSQIFKNMDSFVQSSPLVSAAPVNTVNENGSAKKSKKKFIPIVVGAVVVVFFLAYGVIWAKVFGLF